VLGCYCKIFHDLVIWCFSVTLFDAIQHVCLEVVVKGS